MTFANRALLLGLLVASLVLWAREAGARCFFLECEPDIEMLGMRLSTLSDVDRARYKLPAPPRGPSGGILVTGVEAASPAAQKRIGSGAVIVEVENQKISTVPEFRERVDRLQQQGKRTMLLTVFEPESSNYYIVVLSFK